MPLGGDDRARHAVHFALNLGKEKIYVRPLSIGSTLFGEEVQLSSRALTRCLFQAFFELLRALFEAVANDTTFRVRDFLTP